MRVVGISVLELAGKNTTHSDSTDCPTPFQTTNKKQPMRNLDMKGCSRLRQSDFCHCSHTTHSASVIAGPDSKYRIRKISSGLTERKTNYLADRGRDQGSRISEVFYGA